MKKFYKHLKHVANSTWVNVNFHHCKNKQTNKKFASPRRKSRLHSPVTWSPFCRRKVSGNTVNASQSTKSKRSPAGWGPTAAREKWKCQRRARAKDSAQSEGTRPWFVSGHREEHGGRCFLCVSCSSSWVESRYKCIGSGDSLDTNTARDATDMVSQYLIGVPRPERLR